MVDLTDSQVEEARLRRSIEIADQRLEESQSASQTASFTCVCVSAVIKRS